MIKRKNQISCYYITGQAGAYFVTMERLHNTPSGCPKFRAVIIEMRDNHAGIIDLEDGASYWNAVYDFTGHYYSERQEAQWIVNYYEESTHKEDLKSESVEVINYLTK